MPPVYLLYTLLSLQERQKTVFCEYWGHLKSLKAAAERRFLTIAVARQFLRSRIGSEVGLGCKRKCRSVPVSLAAHCRKKIFLVSADSKNKQTNTQSELESEERGSIFPNQREGCAMWMSASPWTFTHYWSPQWIYRSRTSSVVKMILQRIVPVATM